MEIKDTLVCILRGKIPKYLQFTYNEIKIHLDNCSSITEIVDLPNNGNDSWAQIELNPIYELFESEESEIDCTLLIRDGEFEFSCSIYYPEKHSAYSGEAIFESSVSGLPVEFASINA